MPLEAITDPAEVDERSDLYAVGAVGYFLLTGTNVFEGKTTVEVCGHHLHAPVVPPSERLGRSLPAALERLVVRCLAKKPSDRPQSALALRHELRACRLALAGAGDDWAQEQAQAWWERQGSKLRPAAEATLPTELASTIAVDLARGRTAPAA
jgi:serine/threonine-protein kinase